MCISGFIFSASCSFYKTKISHSRNHAGWFFLFFNKRPVRSFHTNLFFYQTDQAAAVFSLSFFPFFSWRERIRIISTGATMTAISHHKRSCWCLASELKSYRHLATVAGLSLHLHLCVCLHNNYAVGPIDVEYGLYVWLNKPLADVPNSTFVRLRGLKHSAVQVPFSIGWCCGDIRAAIQTWRRQKYRSNWNVFDRDFKYPKSFYLIVDRGGREKVKQNLYQKRYNQLCKMKVSKQPLPHFLYIKLAT